MTAIPTASERTRPMTSRPRFLQGVFGFDGRGLDEPFLLDPSLTYVVPRDTEAQLVYLRAGNAASELITLIITRDGEPLRYFPVGAKPDTHVALRAVEDLLADTRVELLLAAPPVSGH